ncbi:hypothetical protein ACFWXH_13655 [Mesorhizobium sp. NPDC059054]
MIAQSRAALAPRSAREDERSSFLRFALVIIAAGFTVTAILGWLFPALG